MYRSIEYHQTYSLNEQIRIWIEYGSTVMRFIRHNPSLVKFNTLGRPWMILDIYIKNLISSLTFKCISRLLYPVCKFIPPFYCLALPSYKPLNVFQYVVVRTVDSE